MTAEIRQSELDDLDQRWGEAYDLAFTAAGWVAKRLDNGQALVAANPGKLHMLIAADNAASPVRRNYGESSGIAR